MTAILYIFIIKWLKDLRLYISIYTMQYITNNIEYTNQKTIIIYDEMSLLSSEICKYNIPNEVENIIIIGVIFNKPLDNLPYGLKNLLIYKSQFIQYVFNEMINDNISRCKIPFGCNVKIYEPEIKYNKNISLNVDLNIDTLKEETLYIRYNLNEDIPIICKKVSLKRMKNNKTRITF